MNHKKIFLVPIIMLFMSNSLFAEEIKGEILSLKQALELAYRQNPRVNQARQGILAAQGAKITAGSLADPEVELELGGLKKNEEGERDSNLDSITFKQSFDPPGVRYLKSGIAKNDILIREQGLKAVWGEVYTEVRQAYSKIILDKKELELQKANLKSMRQFFSNVQIRYQSGQTFKNQFQRAKVELLKTESDYLKAENDLKIDKARLNVLLGRPRVVAFEIKEELKEEELELNLDELTRLALANRPDLKQEELELNSKNKNYHKEQLSRLPTYSVGFQKIDEDYEQDYAAVFEVSVPLWTFFNQGEVKKARAERDAQKIHYEAARNAVDFEVFALQQDAQLALKQLDLFRKSLDEANEMFRLAGLRYQEGDINFIEYLDQVKASMDSRIQYYRGLHALNQSISNLEKAVYHSLRGEEFLK